MNKTIIFFVILILFAYVLGTTWTNTQRSSTPYVGQIAQPAPQVKQTVNPVAPQPTQEPKVVVKSHKRSVVYGRQGVVGEVVNNGSNTVNYVKVIATFYDESGQVMDSQQTYVDSGGSATIPPSQTAPFKLSVDQGIDFSNYKLVVSWQ